MKPITFIVPIGDMSVYERNFLSSPVLAGNHPHQVIAQKGFVSASAAYNDGLDKAVNDRIICAHQDVVLPPGWDQRFVTAIDKLNDSGFTPVGLVGCIGITSNGKAAGHIYRHDRDFFPQTELPAKVDSFDELLISFSKSSGFRFDPNLPNFHFYAVDLCLQAKSMGYANVVVNVPCFHQGKNRPGKPKEFFTCRSYMAKKWNHMLPVHTLSGVLDRRRESYCMQQAKLLAMKMMGRPIRYWWEGLPIIDPEAILNSPEQS